MSWSDAYERKKHKENQKREIAAFKEAGMTEEQIQSFCELEDEQYRCDRRYRMHTQGFIDSVFDEEEGGDDGQSPLYEHFSEQLTVSMEDEKIHYDKYAWLDEIQDAELYETLKNMSQERLDLITMIAFEERSLTDIAAEKGLSVSAITQRMGTIKKYLKKFSQQP